MEVRLFPNLRRPGVGMRPHRESQRPMLPLHARHCPVLEAGSSMGFLVHPPLLPHEAFHIGYQGEGRYQFVYSVNVGGKRWEPVFTVTFIQPVGAVGGCKEEVSFNIPSTPESRENALLMTRMFIVPEDLGTPAGAVTLRGAWNFRTPDGWDTVYTPVFNLIERPIAPMLVIRVETDWYVHDSEFRYVLQPGEGLSGTHTIPIGQAFFVPREEITFKDCTEDELAAMRKSMAEFNEQKAVDKLTTGYGLQYSPHYLRASRSRGAVVREPASEPASAPAPSSTVEPGAHIAQGPPPQPAMPPQQMMVQQLPREGPASAPQSSSSVPRVGRNDPCPCGSGKKYKKCHGEGQ